MMMLNLDPIWMPETQQSHFRLLMEAMARPGQCYTLTGVADRGAATLAILATLLDAEVSLADPHHLLYGDDWSMLQTKSATAEQADYVLCDASTVPDFMPKIGTLPSPEQSATLLLTVDELGSGNTRLRLTGPGIAESIELQINGLNKQWLSMREDWICAFPLGVDLILLDDKQLAALPRTTKVEVI